MTDHIIPAEGLAPATIDTTTNLPDGTSFRVSSHGDDVTRLSVQGIEGSATLVMNRRQGQLLVNAIQAVADDQTFSRHQAGR